MSNYQLVLGLIPIAFIYIDYNLNEWLATTGKSLHVILRFLYDNIQLKTCSMKMSYELIRVRMLISLDPFKMKP